MRTIRKVLTCFGCVLGGAFAAAMLKVLIGMVVMHSRGLDEAAYFLDTANALVAPAGGLLGLAIFLRSIQRQKSEQLKERNPNQASVTARKLAEPQG